MTSQVLLQSFENRSNESLTSPSLLRFSSSSWRQSFCPKPKKLLEVFFIQPKKIVGCFFGLSRKMGPRFFSKHGIWAQRSSWWVTERDRMALCIFLVVADRLKLKINLILNYQLNINIFAYFEIKIQHPAKKMNETDPGYSNFHAKF